MQAAEEQDNVAAQHAADANNRNEQVVIDDATTISFSELQAVANLFPHSEFARAAASGFTDMLPSKFQTAENDNLADLDSRAGKRHKPSSVSISMYDQQEQGCNTVGQDCTEVQARVQASTKALARAQMSVALSRVQLTEYIELFVDEQVRPSPV